MRIVLLCGPPWLAQQWHAQVYLLNPGETECKRRAVLVQRPSGTRRAIGVWYHRYSPLVRRLGPSDLGPPVGERRATAADG
jgi:hypothetical protein